MFCSVSCALSGFAALGGRRCLAPVRMPRFWPVACVSGEPWGPAWCASVLQSAFPTPWCLSPTRALASLALLGGRAGCEEASREPGSLCLLLAPAEAWALGSLRVVPVRRPAMGLSLAGPSGVSLGLLLLRCLACVDPVTDASGFPYRPSFDGVLSRCTGAVSCGRRHLPLRVGGPHAGTPCMCACARPSWLGQAGRPPGRVVVRLTFSFGRLVFLFCLAPSGLGLPPPCSFFCPPPPFVLFFSVVVFCAPPLSLALFGFRPQVPQAFALCVVCFVGSLFALAWFVCLALPMAAPLWLLLPHPLLRLAVFVAAARCLGFVFLFFSFFFCFSFCLRPRCLWVSLVSVPRCPRPWRCVLFVLLALRSLSRLLCVPLCRWLLLGGWCRPNPLLRLTVFVAAARCLAFVFLFFSFFLLLLLSAPPLSLAFSGFGPLGALGLGAVLCVVFLFHPALASPCALSFFVSPAGLLAVLWWLLPPPASPLVSRDFAASARCLVVVFFFSSFVRSRCLRLSLVSGTGCPWPSRCDLFVLWASCCPALRVLSPRFCVSPGHWLLPGCCCPLPPFVSLGFRRRRLVLCFFSFCRFALPLSLAFSGSRPRVPWASALCVVCFVGLPLLGSLCALASFVLPAWPLAAPWWLLPPPAFVSRGLRRCRSVLCAVCCAVLCVPGCVSAPHCCALCRPVLCCCVLCCVVALVWCRCLLCHALCRCPSP